MVAFKDGTGPLGAVYETSSSDGKLPPKEYGESVDCESCACPSIQQPIDSSISLLKSRYNEKLRVL